MKKNLENKLLAVVRVRGTVKVRQSITETLNRLNLKRPNNMIFIYGNKSNIGMLSKCIDYVTFGEADKEIVERVLKREGVAAKKESVDELFGGKKSLKELNVKVPFRMHPPKRGYENTKSGYTAGGALGYRGNDINELVKRML